MKRALEILYGGKAYHMSEVLNKPRDLKFWSKLVSGELPLEEVDWRQFFKGYIALTDMPSAYFFESIVKAFPNIKVVLTYRNEQDWLNSYTKLMSSALRFEIIRFLPPLNRLWPFAEKLHDLLFGQAVTEEGKVCPEMVLEGYREHNRRVRRYFNEKELALLEFNVKEGWLPLCDFLDVGVPSTRFPHRNSGGKGPAKIIANSVSQLSILPIIFSIVLIILSLRIILFLLQDIK